MYRQAIQYVNVIRDWTQNNVSFPIFSSPLLHSSVFFFPYLLSDVTPAMCLPNLLCCQLPHPGHGATEGGRMRGGGSFEDITKEQSPNWYQVHLASNSQAAKAESSEIKNNESINLRFSSDQVFRKTKSKIFLIPCKVFCISFLFPISGCQYMFEKQNKTCTSSFPKHLHTSGVLLFVFFKLW